MANFGKERFPQSYQASVGMSASPRLHKNSIELVQILAENEILTPDSKIFELGSGPARNLYYMYQTMKDNGYSTDDLQLYASDLFKEHSFRSMDPDIRKVLNFLEGDSEDIANNNIIPDLDLFLVSDHFMHLQYDKADNIIKKIISDWKPKHIMLRELKKQFETPDHPRLFHNYNQLLGDYEKIVETSSKQDDAYFIWLLKRK